MAKRGVFLALFAIALSVGVGGVALVTRKTRGHAPSADIGQLHHIDRRYHIYTGRWPRLGFRDLLLPFFNNRATAPGQAVTGPSAWPSGAQHRRSDHFPGPKCPCRIAHDFHRINIQSNRKFQLTGMIANQRDGPPPSFPSMYLGNKIATFQRGLVVVFVLLGSVRQLRPLPLALLVGYEREDVRYPIQTVLDSCRPT